MSDVFIPDVPDDVLRALDARAVRLGLSRNEYLRRRLAQEAVSAVLPVGITEFTSFAQTFADLADPAVMDKAWE